MSTPSRTLVRIIGRELFDYPRSPGYGADQPRAKWHVGKCSMILVPVKPGEFAEVWCRLLDWFQPDSNPALTIYVFEPATLTLHRPRQRGQR